LIAAQKRELRGLERRAGPVEDLQWPVDHAALLQRAGAWWFLIANGAGPRRAAEAVRTAFAREEFDAVVSTGFCGGLDPRLGPGSIVAATEVVAGNSAEAWSVSLPAVSWPFVAGPVVTLNRVAGSRLEKQRLREKGFVAVDMESAGVAGELVGSSTLFFCVRAVTDTVAETFRIDLNRARDADGRIDDMRVIRIALRHPACGIPELWRLFRRSRLAAERLGEFLVECEF